MSSILGLNKVFKEARISALTKMAQSIKKKKTKLLSLDVDLKMGKIVVSLKHKKI